MITVITGLTGTGKTWLMTRLALKARKEGELIYANMALTFPNDNEGVVRWHHLSETYNLHNGTVVIDEGQKLFDAHAWPFLPASFSEMIASHRHNFLNIITTTQDFGHIDLRVRSNVHELYGTRSIFRWPRSDRVRPWLQMIKVTKKQRSFDDSTGIKWLKASEKTYFISKYFTKELYNTYANIDLSHYICTIKRDKKKWLIQLHSRRLANARR